MNRDRRREFGKTLLDIGKYVFTVGILGGFLRGRLDLGLGLSLFGIGFILLIVGYYLIPPDREA